MDLHPIVEVDKKFRSCSYKISKGDWNQNWIGEIGNEEIREMSKQGAIN